MQATTSCRVAGMRAASLKAGITMLYFGYCVTTTLFPHAPMVRIPVQTQDRITPRGWLDSARQPEYHVFRQPAEAKGSILTGYLDFWRLTGQNPFML